jgi:hypothetical protein
VINARILGSILTLLAVGCIEPAVFAQHVALDPKPRRVFVTFSIDVARQQPLHFKRFPLEQLVGQSLDEIQDRNNPLDYRAKDGFTSVDVVEYSKRTQGLGLTVYPFGARSGATLAVRVTRETLPVIRFNIARSGVFERYELTDGVATDAGLGVMMMDRSSGWGLGAHSFVIGGIGRVRGALGDGRRTFAEGGGGISIGPFGVDAGVKFAYNRFDNPRPHTFFTVPISIKGTLTF